MQIWSINIYLNILASSLCWNWLWINGCHQELHVLQFICPEKCSKLRELGLQFYRPLPTIPRSRSVKLRKISVAASTMQIGRNITARSTRSTRLINTVVLLIFLFRYAWLRNLLNSISSLRLSPQNKKNTKKPTSHSVARKREVSISEPPWDSSNSSYSMDKYFTRYVKIFSVQHREKIIRDTIQLKLS